MFLWRGRRIVLIWGRINSSSAAWNVKFRDACHVQLLFLIISLVAKLECNNSYPSHTDHLVVSLSVMRLFLCRSPNDH